MTNNGTKNGDKKVEETLREFNIHHITTSFNNPQGNREVS